MDFKRTGSKVKGFTLVELIVVIAIIGVLSGIISMAISAYMRDARIETNNNKAQMIYTGFQNILIQCEINQDDEVFDVGRYNSTVIDSDINYVQVYFEMEQAKLGDNVMLAVNYANGSVNNMPVKNVSTDATYQGYKVIENAITSYLDNSFEGFAAVYIDYTNFQVDSVIYYEPNAFKGNLAGNYTTDVAAVMANLATYADYYKYSSSTYSFRMLNSFADQKKYYENVGPHLGAYPMADSYGKNDAPEKVTS